MEETGQQITLLVSSMTGVQNFAEALSQETGVTVQVARNLRAALAVLRRKEFTAVLVDTATIPVESTELVWQRTGLAIPVEMSLGQTGHARVVREVTAVLQRRDREIRLARMEAANAVQDELRQQLAGLLLQTELMMREPAIPPAIARKAQTLHELAGALCVRFRSV